MWTQFIINPHSGRSEHRSLESRIRREFSGLPFELQCTSGPGHATQLARSASAAGARTVVAAGGDGIVNEVLNGITGTGAALGIIPAGTANDLARHLGISGDLSALRATVCGGHTVTVDAVEVNGRHFLTGGGTGLVCDAAQRANRLKSGRARGHTSWPLTGGRLYLLAALMALVSGERDPKPVSLQVDGRWTVADPLWIAVSNQPRLGRYFLVSPRARNNDGFFNVCVAQNTGSRVNALGTLIRSLAGKHERMEGVSVFRSREMTIRSSAPMGFMGDGELLCTSTELRIRIRPSSVRVMVPAPQRGAARRPDGFRKRP